VEEFIVVDVVVAVVVVVLVEVVKVLEVVVVVVAVVLMVVYPHGNTQQPQIPPSNNLTANPNSAA
jgi:hypothetical protein